VGLASVQTGFEGVLDVLPTPLLLIEPGTARVFFANRAAHRLAGGSFPLGKPADEYHTVYSCFDAAGARIPNDEMPGVRAARGETFANVHLDWETPGGLRSLVVAGDTIALPEGAVTVVTFEEVTDVERARRLAQRARDDLEAILGGVADSVTAQTAEGKLVYANQAAADLLGYASSEELLAAPMAELIGRYEMLDEKGEPLELARLPGRQALAGEQPEPITVRYRRAGDAEVRWSRVKATPVRDEEGRVRMAINVIEDITEIKRAEEGQRFLAEASRTLAGSLDYASTLAAVAQSAVPGIADWCAVDVAVEGTLDRVAVAHVDPERVALAQELQSRHPPDESAGGIYEVLRNGEPLLIPEVTDEMIVAAARDDEHLRMLHDLEIRSAMVVPMALRDRVLGAITFVSSETGRRFDQHDLALAQDLGLRAAAAVENARLYEIAQATARTLQASLLPPHLPDVPGIELGSAYRPAGEGYEVGGDFYDVFSVAEDQWYAVIGDVCGKGAAAAAVTALARYTIRATAVRRRAPSAILRWLNDAMLSQDDGSGRFCTIACAHLDLSGPAPLVTVACGGHPAPVVRRADGGVAEIGTAGTLLGLFDEPDLYDESTELGEDDVLVLYTDGLTEAGAPERVWAPEDLEAAVSATGPDGAQETVNALLERALGDLRLPPRDDVAVLALRASRTSNGGR
jgi:PAS domain S-box-containing protein